jgi:hypothetical protein
MRGYLKNLHFLNNSYNFKTQVQFISAAFLFRRRNETFTSKNSLSTYHYLLTKLYHVSIQLIYYEVHPV